MAENLFDNYDPDASEVSRPILVGAFACTITDVQDNSASERPEYQFALKLDEMGADVAGVPINPGLTLTDFVSLAMPKDASKAAVMRDIKGRHVKVFKMAALGLPRTKEGETTFAALPQSDRDISRKDLWVGKRVVVRFAARTDDKGEVRQDIKGYAPVK